MKYLVMWADEASPNLGLRALAEGARAFLKAVNPDARVEFQNIAGGSFGNLITRKQLVKEILSGGGPVTRWIQGYDLVFDVGMGDSFTDIYGLERLSHIVLNRIVQRRAGVPVVFGPQTFGPFQTYWGRRVARFAMRLCALAFARDSRSAEIARRDTGIALKNASDLVFLLKEEVRQFEGRRVLFNVSGLLWNGSSHTSSAAYRNACLEIVRELLSRRYRVTLIAHVLDGDEIDNDISAVIALAENFGDKVDVFVPSSLDDARFEIARSSFVIGARMHACLNALSQGVPAIAWAYSRKFAPLLHDLGWNEVVPLQELHADDIVAQTLRCIERIETGESNAISIRAVARSLNEQAVAETAAFLAVTRR